VDLIERVGSYVGLASFLGLAVLALLYFSQARDVRRLREWAGRAPERTTETAARGTEPGAAVGADTAQLPTAAHHLPATPFSQTATRTRKPLRDRIRNVHIPQLRYMTLVAAGLVVLGGAAFGAVQLVGGTGDDGGSPAPAGNQRQAQREHTGTSTSERTKAANIDPATVTVAVLNGTTVQGLAAKIGQEVSANGFTIGTIGNAAKIDQARTEVLYAKGQSAAARAVANRLGIQATGPVDSVNAEIAGSFDAVVLVGADRGG
jgi:LytR cell envelope-related transcriptional attenuator